MAIEKRIGSDGKPQYRVRIATYHPVTGKRQNLTVGTYRTKREAEGEERKAIEQRDRGTLLQPDRTTIGELLDRWYEVEVKRSVKPENQQEYRIVIDKHLKPTFGSVKVRKLKVEQVEQFYADLQAAGKSSSLIKKCHMRLNSALKAAVRWNLVAENICDVIKPPKLTYKQPTIWTPEETVAFLDAAESDPLAIYWRLAVETGARTSELLGITWDDVDLDRGTLRLGYQVVRLLRGTPFVKQDPKTEAGRRTIRLTADMIADLRAYQVMWNARKLAAHEWDNPQGLIFCSLRGRPLNARNLRRSFDKLIKVAGVTPVPPHSIRKLHITSTIAAGGNLKAVAARVGHRDLTTTIKTYQQLTAGMDDELMAIVATVTPARKAAQTS